jgi:K+/H+ antiporter YhaU regulatory subunit KhtT
LVVRKGDGAFDFQPQAASTINQDDVLVVIGTQAQFEALEKMALPGKA